MSAYDNYEYHPCIVISTLPDGTQEIEQVLEGDVEHDTIAFWTVYGHLPSGGVDAIVDYKIKRHAVLVYLLLQSLLEEQA